MIACTFTTGCFSIKSPHGGKVEIHFEDSDHFGPTRVDMRTGKLTEIKAYWFWIAYDKWRKAGKPVTGRTFNWPNGLLQECANG